MKLVGSLSTLLLLATVAVHPQDAAEGREVRRSDPLYSLKATETIVRFYTLGKEQPDLEKTGAALQGLGASIVYGPRVSLKRPGSCFVAVRAPVGALDSELAKELRKSCGSVHELFCTVFEGHTPNVGMDADLREDAIEMFRQVAWIDSAGPWTQLYLDKPPSAADADDMSQRYDMMSEHSLKLGRLARESFTWTLTSAPDEPVRERVLKSVRKLDGVVKATLGERELTLVVELSRLRGSGEGSTLATSQGLDQLDAAGRAAPRAIWCTQPLFQLLAQEELVPRATAGPGR